MANLLKAKTIYGDTFFIKKDDYENNKKNLLKLYDKNGKERLGRTTSKNCVALVPPLHRDNIISIIPHATIRA